jgi:cysteinyl-tRNA synthetase
MQYIGIPCNPFVLQCSAGFHHIITVGEANQKTPIFFPFFPNASATRFLSQTAAILVSWSHEATWSQADKLRKLLRQNGIEVDDRDRSWSG